MNYCEGSADFRDENSENYLDDENSRTVSVIHISPWIWVSSIVSRS